VFGFQGGGRWRTISTVSYLLKIDAILVSVGGSVAVGDVDGDVIVVTVSKVDVVTGTAVGVGRSRRGGTIDLGACVVNFDADICVAQTVV